MSSANQRKREENKERFERKRHNKKPKQSFDVWRSMSVNDLARTMQRTPDDIFELMLMVEGTDHLRYK